MASTFIKLFFTAHFPITAKYLPMTADISIKNNDILDPPIIKLLN